MYRAGLFLLLALLGSRLPLLGWQLQACVDGTLDTVGMTAAPIAAVRPRYATDDVSALSY